jgi:hypothetical protein
MTIAQISLLPADRKQLELAAGSAILQQFFERL